VPARQVFKHAVGERRQSVKEVIERLRTVYKRLGDIYGLSQTTQLEIVKETRRDIDLAIEESARVARTIRFVIENTITRALELLDNSSNDPN
jgi:galactokinase